MGDAVAAEILEDFKVTEYHDERKEIDEKMGLKYALSCNLNEEKAGSFLEWLIHPVNLDTFYEKHWERTPFLVRRTSLRDYYQGWFSKEDVESLLKDGKLEYGIGVDVTKYINFERQTYNGKGIANSKEVWEKFNEGCSVRILHPQRWINKIWLMLSVLETHWNSIAGCNVYLTPEGSQGFSPHFDDIEAFILQLEGKKKWKCYKPRSEAEVLPRFSSQNFSQEEIGEPILEVDLQPGDLLFMPRGTIHQAVSLADSHSLHLTISVGQRNSWADYLELALPRAIELASEEHVELRSSLPRNVFSFMGVVHQDKEEDENRKVFMDTMSTFFDYLMDSAPWDSAVDQLAVGFVHKRLPVYPGNPKKQGKKKGGGNAKVGLKTKVKLAAPGVARLVLENDSAVVHHMMDNSREEHNLYLEEGEEEGSEEEEVEEIKQEINKKRKVQRGENKGLKKEKGRISFSVEAIEVLDQLMSAYPESVVVDDIEAENMEELLQIVRSLVAKNVLVVET